MLKIHWNWRIDKVGTLVLQPMMKYKKAIKLLSSHSSNTCHVTAMIKMEDIFNIVRNPTREIDVIIAGKKIKQIENNWRLLVPI